jgi:hypothetical protein
MRFLATCACDKLIVDKIGAHSLINVVSGLDIAMSVPPDAPQQIPPSAMLPREWWIFSMWEPRSDEVGKDFEQVIEVYWPNGEKLLDGRLNFKPDEKVSYNSYQVVGLPIGQEGKIKILTWVESQGSRITEPFAYYITIKYVREDHYPKGTPSARAVLQIPQ